MNNIFIFALQTLFELNPFHLLPGADFFFDPIDAIFSWLLAWR